MNTSRYREDRLTAGVLGLAIVLATLMVATMLVAG
jgi:hypothetical protein